VSGPPVRITIYNHKGGVGKTTLTVNIACALAELGKSALLVDSDPQCNLTSYLLSDDVVDDLLDRSDGPRGRTVWTAVKRVVERSGHVRTIEPLEIRDIALLPGDIRLFECEEFLAEAWTDSFKRRLGGLRAIASISDLVSRVSQSRAFDFVFYDTGPNIGSLNRVLLLDSDFFIVPVACDLFSVRALGTLGETLKRWIVDARTIASLAPDGADLLRAAPRFLGYIPQRFKVYGQAMAGEPTSYLREIRRKVYERVGSVLHTIDPTLAPDANTDPVVGQIRDFGSLVQTAQREGAPIWECSGTNQRHKNEAKREFRKIAQHIIDATLPAPAGRASRGR